MIIYKDLDLPHNYLYLMALKTVNEENEYKEVHKREEASVEDIILSLIQPDHARDLG